MKKNIKKTKAINLSWEEIDKYIGSLLSDINENDFRFDLLVTINRGGLIPAVVLSHKLSVREIIIFRASRTVDDRINAVKHPPTITYSVKELVKIKNKKILLIDDIVGSGETLKKVKKTIQNFNPKSLICATLLINLDNLIDLSLKPDFYAREVRGWVIFPWEEG